MLNRALCFCSKSFFVLGLAFNASAKNPNCDMLAFHMMQKLAKTNTHKALLKEVARNSELSGLASIDHLLDAKGTKDPEAEALLRQILSSLENNDVLSHRKVAQIAARLAAIAQKTKPKPQQIDSLWLQPILEDALKSSLAARGRYREPSKITQTLSNIMRKHPIASESLFTLVSTVNPTWPGVPLYIPMLRKHLELPVGANRESIAELIQSKGWDAARPEIEKWYKEQSPIKTSYSFDRYWNWLSITAGVALGSASAYYSTKNKLEQQVQVVDELIADNAEEKSEEQIRQAFLELLRAMRKPN